MVDFSIVHVATAIAASVVLLMLNIFLSSRKNPIFSFILPVLSFAVSLVFLVLGILTLEGNNSPEAFFAVFKAFFILNMPTLVFILSSLLTRHFFKNQ